MLGLTNEPGGIVKERFSAAFPALGFENPARGILELIMSREGKLNAADRGMHRQLADVWAAIDKDDEVDVVIVRGEGGAFSAGGDFDMIDDIIGDFADRATVWREARDLVYNTINCSKPIVSAMEGPAVGAGLVIGLLADVSIAGRSARIIDGHTRIGVVAGDHAAIVWPLLCGLAKSKYHLLLCEPLSGEEAERIGLVSLVVDDGHAAERAMQIATRLQQGSSTAIRWTKYALNNWLRLAGPTFDTSLALEFLAFTGPDAREGVDSARQKRRPDFRRAGSSPADLDK
jgi:enoyl-CoA hydratase